MPHGDEPTIQPQSVNDGRGSSWGIWDLHVHTPASLVQSYGGNTDEVWEKFIADLENMPEDIKVIGINDYWFLDGYKRVLEAKKTGRLQNLDAIFPVVEMRLRQFGGADGNLSRINLHVIFDPDLSPDLIEKQFISALTSKVKLSPSAESLTWQGVITREALEELGRKIKSTVPEDKLSDYKSDLIEGFNNLNVDLAAVEEILENNRFLKGKALIGIGRVEWADMKWTNQSIADKKNVINAAGLLFTAFEDISRWGKTVGQLRGMGVQYKVLDCSDAHHFSDAAVPLRIGNCQTWMNTTPTFAGLLYALEEFDRRVYVGLQPPTLSRIRENPDRFIQRVRVASENPERILFCHDIQLNPGFVAIVGNKGQGKSALLDCIALAGNSSRKEDFAFLNSERFLSRASKEDPHSYYSEIFWENGASRKVFLDSEFEKSSPIAVEYLPQAYVERVCNPAQADGEISDFEREIREVLFTHIPEERRDGARTFDELLGQKTQAHLETLESLRQELRDLVDHYVSEVQFVNENSLKDVEARLKQKRDEVDLAAAQRNSALAELKRLDAEEGLKEQVEPLRERAEDLQKREEKLRADLASVTTGQGDLRKKQGELRRIIRRSVKLGEEVEILNTELRDLFGDIDLKVFSLVVDESQVDSWAQEITDKLENLSELQVSISQDLERVSDEREENSNQLATLDSVRELARQKFLQSTAYYESLIGHEENLESLKGLEALLRRIESGPQEIGQRVDKMLACSKRIYEELTAQLDVVQELYSPVTEFVRGSAVVQNAELEFEAILRPTRSLGDLVRKLDGRRNGDFSNWVLDIPARLGGAEWSEFSVEFKKVLDRLARERGDEDGAPRNPRNALRSQESLGDFLTALFDLSWLGVRFDLIGSGRPLSQLSPGQRGLILAMFYLVVDRRTSPLLLDQPEENLDNETIAAKLVPAIREAAGRRQTIVVTHNANLAIVGDADQIIHCELDDGVFKATSGSIAELQMAEHALDVLEGTKPAFDNRRHKYEAFPSLA